jgi:hypothetical protein
MRKKITLGLIALLIVGATLGGWIWHRERQLSRMVGQMILVGFRGTLPTDASVRDVADDIRAGKIGGVILFSVDVEKLCNAGIVGNAARSHTKSRNIIDVNQKNT